MKRLNGMDAMLLYSETPNLHTHTVKVAVIDATDFDGDFTFDVFRQTVRRRLHLLDPLRYRLVDIPWKMHHPMWMENCEVDLDYHLRRVQVPAPGGRRELDQVIGEIASSPLDRGHPLWEFHFAEGLALDDHEVLQRLSAECGMDERRVAAVLAADSYADRVRADEQRARAMGVTATPFILANGYAALTGLHPTADYLALLRGAAVA